MVQQTPQKFNVGAALANLALRRTLAMREPNGWRAPRLRFPRHCESVAAFHFAATTQRFGRWYNRAARHGWSQIGHTRTRLDLNEPERTFAIATRLCTNARRGEQTATNENETQEIRILPGPRRFERGAVWLAPLLGNIGKSAAAKRGENATSHTDRSDPSNGAEP